MRAVRAFALLGCLIVLAAALPGAGGARAAPRHRVPPPSSIVSLPPRAGGHATVPPLAKRSRTPDLGPFGAPARVNRNVQTLFSAQTEPSLANNPADHRHVVAGFADRFFDWSPGVSISNDGGANWASPLSGPVLPDPPGFAWGDRGLPDGLAGGDASVVWGADETVYYATLGFQNTQEPPLEGICSNGGLYVYRSLDGGQTWELPADGPAVANSQTHFVDKEYLAIDVNAGSPHYGRLYMAWEDDEYTGCPHHFASPEEDDEFRAEDADTSNYVDRKILVAHSDDGGASWSTPVQLAHDCVIAAIPAVAIDGTLYVTWYDCNDGTAQLVRRSSDGGATFARTIVAGRVVDCPDPLPGATFRVLAAFPSIAADPTKRGDVYVTWASCNGAGQSDVFLSRSRDQGRQFSKPVRVNDDALDNPRDQFFPWVTVDVTGVVRVMFGDDRYDLVNAGGHLYDITVAESFDHGKSFAPNIRVTPASSDPTRDGFGGLFIGDYFGMTACGPLAWAGTHLGGQDIFAAARLDADGDCSPDAAPTSR